MNILFRCDGSVEIGMGHVVRCLALADELLDNDVCNITFAMRQSELGIQKVKSTYTVIAAEHNDTDFNYRDWLTNCIKVTNAEILIMDVRDGLARASLKEIKQATGIKVVTIDDPEDKRLEADLAFYPPVPQVKRMNWDDFKGKLYTGWEYVILRKEFLKTYPKPENIVPNILVSMGATDPKNLIDFVVDTLDNISHPFHANIVIGEGYSRKDKLIEKLANSCFNYNLLINRPNIAEIMAKSDLAIISFGQTAYELASIGIPAIYVCLSEDHLQSSLLFEQKGIGITAGVYSQIAQTNLRSKVLLLLEHKDLQIKMKIQTTSVKNPDVKKIARLIVNY